MSDLFYFQYFYLFDLTFTFMGNARHFYLTNHEIRDHREHCNGNKPQGNDIGNNLGYEICRHTIVSTGILMTVYREKEHTNTI